LAQQAQAPNPLFTFERLVRKEDGGVDLDIGRMLSTSLFHWITLPMRRTAVDQQQARLHTQSAQQLVQTVTHARQAWVLAVAAAQVEAYYVQAREAAEASAELARRMFAVGNFSKLQRAREQAFYADTASGQARAQHATVAAREALVRALGLTPAQATQLKLPARLPDLPSERKTAPQVTTQALAQRLDIKLADSQAQYYGATRRLNHLESVIGDIHLEGVRNSETGKPAQRGFEIELPLPIFDWGGAKRAEFAARQLAMQHRAEDVTRKASSQLREHYSAYTTTYDIAKHYRDEIVPLRKLIAEEMLLKYNGMLIGVFDLLADAREQIGSVISAIDAQRDFWLADAALAAAVIGVPIETLSLSAAPMKSTGSSETH
jgi:outer membrane protein TolC